MLKKSIHSFSDGIPIPGILPLSSPVVLPFEVLVLTILSAQTTDRAVLKVKEALFSAYPTPSALAKAKTDDVETIIHSLGYFHAKARHIIAASQVIISEFGGRVPETMEDLLKIPGVGRKTANIVLYHAHGRNEGIAVDTHVRRLAQRIGFSDTDNVRVIETGPDDCIPTGAVGGSHGSPDRSRANTMYR